MAAEDELTVVVTDRNGITKTFGSDEPGPADRPQGITFGSQLASGFYTGGFTLSCAIDDERDDLHLLDDVRIITQGGDIVYEGFIAAMPRATSGDGQGTLTITTAGYIATAQGQPFTAIFIDRDLSAWGEASIAQRIVMIAAGYNPDGGTLTVTPDSIGKPALSSSRTGVLNKPMNRYVYDAGMNNRVAKLYVNLPELSNLSSADVNLGVYAIFWSDDAGSNQILSINLKAASAISQDISATPRRFAVMDWRYEVNGGTAGVDYAVRWRDVRVIGDHGITMITDPGSSFPAGISASEVIKWTAARYAPLLNTSGVQDTTYPIAQLAFKDRTTAYDCWLKVNSYHLWNISVWENRTLTFSQVDLADWDWEIRHDDVGNTIGLQGDEYTQLRNGIVVQFTNIQTGHAEELLPADHAGLRDDSIDNPFNQHGWTWTGEPFTVPYPTTQADALELGRIRLLEDNQVRAPGSFTIQGRVRDRAGNWQPVANVRAGQRIRLTSSGSLSDRPRLIHEASYSHDGRTVTIAVDSTLRYLEGILDRTSTALTAAGLI